MKSKYEDSPDDKKKDKAASKRLNMSLKSYEKSSIDKRADKVGQKMLDHKNKAKKK